MQAFAQAFFSEFGIVDGVARLKFAGRTDKGLVREVFEAQGVPVTEANFRRFYDRYVFLLHERLNDCRGGPIPGVQSFLQQLEALPQPPMLGLLTGNIRLGAEIKLRRAGLWDLFETGGFADDHEERDHIAAIARDRGGQLLRESLADGETLVIGDTPLDIKCGRAIGAKVLAVATGGATLGELRQHQPDWAVASLAEITPSVAAGRGA